MLNFSGPNQHGGVCVTVFLVGPASRHIWVQQYIYTYKPNPASLLMTHTLSSLVDLQINDVTTHSCV